MLLTNLDTLVRRGLLETNRPIHYYAQDLFLSASCIRELSFDSLQIVNAANLPVNSYGAVDLPDDFVDDLGVSLGGQVGALSMLPKQDWINPIRIHDTTSGNFVPYTTTTENEEDDTTFWGFPAAWGWYYWNVNDIGEPTGRFFGSPGGTQQGYKVIRERRQIQMSAGFEGGNIILLYISDGQSADNASQVDVMAFAVIRAYIEWKRSPNANNENSPEGKGFYNQKRLYRARKNELTLCDLRNVYRNNYRASIKS